MIKFIASARLQQKGVQVDRGEHRHEEHAVAPVHHPAVSGDQTAEVLRLAGPFEPTAEKSSNWSKSAGI